ncbi:MAG TPA: acyltransferase family protein, partial [Sphingomicrobium sp.]|nr:acyltransferase family protein [Sphingomicrobium sp.]
MARLGHIDALRGLAALSVVIQHSAELVGLGFGAFNGGRFGVLLFFLLSGFVIPFSFSGDEPIRRFLISRFFRLYPAFWASLIAASLVSFVPPGEFAANATMAPILFGQPLSVGAYWTLFFELCFYGLCILLFMSGMQTRYVGALAVVFLAWFPAPG